MILFELIKYRRLKYLLPIAVTALVAIALFSQCTTPLDIENVGGERKLVIHGYIHNGEPPYSVEITRSQLYTGGLNGIEDISGAVVTLHEEGGTTEDMKEVSPGVYQSCDERIRGIPGRAYWVSVFLPQTGDSYYSEEEVMPYPATITDLTVEQESRQTYSEQGILINQSGFAVKLSFEEDSDSQDQYFIKYKGTYTVTTDPKSATRGEGGNTIVPAPEPCSGYIYNEDQGLVQVEECTCCTCYVRENFSDPVLVDDRRLADGNVESLEVEFVPTNASNSRIGNDYWIGAEVRSMTRGAYDYWDVLLKQKNGNGSIFQPPPTPLPGNIRAEGEAPQALGYFYAAARDIEGFAAGELIRMGSSTIPQDFSCLRYENSVNVKPDYYPF